ncbi:MAG: extracellular solute-binding protein, partial [Acidimicrobiia bacterium]|nr:extracellular solute-binding protein [Acidimicrobiia bacterium]
MPNGQTPLMTPRPRWGALSAALVLATVIGLVASACTVGSGSAGADSQTVTVYTGRHYGIEEVFEQFTAETGIKVRFTTGSDPELRERLIAEGSNSPADLVIVADAANISLSDRAGVLAPVDSPTLRAAIPSELRSVDDTWFALSRRLRTIVYADQRVGDPPVDYADLGDPRWKGRLCLRPSTHP